MGGGIVHDLRDGSARKLVSNPGKIQIDPESWPVQDRIAISGWNDGVAVFDTESPADRLWAPAGEGRANRIRRFAGLSADGELIAYASNEGVGQFQIRIEEIDGSSRVQIPAESGTEPVWCRECDDLFFRVGQRVFASRITREPRLEAGPPREIFEASDFVDTRGISIRVSSDGRRLYYVRRSRPPRETESTSSTTGSTNSKLPCRPADLIYCR